MKRLLLAALFAAVAGAASADPLEGLWQTKADDNGNYGHVKVVPCGDAFCGALQRSFDAQNKELTESPNLGKKIIWAMKPAGGGKYEGKIWSPDRDKTYDSKLQLSGKSLKVSGCVLGFCRDGGTWTKLQ